MDEHNDEDVAKAAEEAQQDGSGQGDADGGKGEWVNKNNNDGHAK